MNTRPVSHEDVERYVGELPLAVVCHLPHGPLRASAAEHIRAATRLAHKAVEEAQAPPPVPWARMLQDDEQGAGATSLPPAPSEPTPYATSAD